MATETWRKICRRSRFSRTFLAAEQAKDLLRFTTAGSVDDGKSTLIGRLLYDSRSVYEDQLESVTKASVGRNVGAIDFSLLTDGLRAEREQGITIDVAYRYFATPKRKFIIADTPGHEQYTRNMVTGASTAELAIVLVDARKGVLPQSRRHAFIATLLGLPQLVVAVNKMDLVGFDQGRVRCHRRTSFRQFLGDARIQPYFVPISALTGDNVVTRSSQHALVRGTKSSGVSRDRAHGRARSRSAVPFSGAARSPAGPGFPWLCRNGRVGNDTAGGSGDRAAFGTADHGADDYHLRWRSARGGSAPSRHAQPRGRGRHQPRRHDRCSRRPARLSRAGSRRRMVWLNATPARLNGRYRIKLTHQTGARRTSVHRIPHQHQHVGSRRRYRARNE